MFGDLESARSFRIWEGKNNYVKYNEEKNTLHKSSVEAREKHLDEIASQLTRWKTEISEILAKRNYDRILAIGNEPQFENVMWHCDQMANIYRIVKFEILGNPHTDGTLYANHQKKVTDLMMALIKETEQTLKKKKYANGWCLDCTREKAIQTT